MPNRRARMMNKCLHSGRGYAILMAETARRWRRPAAAPQGPKGQRIRTVLVYTSPVESVVATRRLSRCVRPRLRPVSRARATN